LETPGTEMPSGWDIASLPNNVWIKGQDPMRPTLVASNRSLKNELVNLEEETLMLRTGMGRLSSVGACENYVANSD